MSTEFKNEFEKLVSIVIREDASDLHLSEGRQPVLRVSGFLVPVSNFPVITRQDMKAILDQVLNAQKKEVFLAEKQVDFAYDTKEARFRGNAFFQMGKMSLALRLIPKVVRSFEELKLPEILESFTTRQQGFFLVVGPTGHGKSTTLAAMIDRINSERLEHIVTIEDPVEYVFESKKALIDQREVSQDTTDIHTALVGMFRQDIDVLMIGEMRTTDDISTAVTAAETGHLVFSTLHTNNAAQTIDRIIDSFDKSQQRQISYQLASSLIAIMSQRLIPRISGGLIPACELLINTTAVSNLIRENRIYEISSLIETGGEVGMIDLNRYLSDLVRAGEITIENAYLYSHNVKGLERML